MIRQLKEVDRQTVLNYLYKESTYNIFIIGDIEAFGFESVFQSVYAEFDKQNNYLSVLLFYRENCVFYAHQERFNLDYLPIMKEHVITYLSGKESLVDLVFPHLNGYEKKPMYFCEATQLNSSVTDFTKVRVIKTKEDCERLYDLLSTVTEFNVKDQTKEYFVEGKLKSIHAGLTTVIEEDGRFVSTVAATADTKLNAMVIGVATIEPYRKKGYASILMSHLMNEYLHHQHKSLCLFYDNPNAGKIYKRLGFEDIGKWAMLQRSHD